VPTIRAHEGKTESEVDERKVEHVADGDEGCRVEELIFGVSGNWNNDDEYGATEDKDRNDQRNLLNISTHTHCINIQLSDSVKLRTTVQLSDSERFIKRRYINVLYE